MAQQVWLGLAGDLCGVAPSDHYTTRIGGPPIFPGAVAPQWKGSSCPSCAVCGAPLSLVLQAYAPLPDLPDRTLLLLGCTSSGCGKGQCCWQAVRCQLLPQTAQAQQQQQHNQQQQQHQQDGPVHHQPNGILQQSSTGSDTPQPGPTGFDALGDPGFGAAGATDTWGCEGDAAGGSSSFGGWDAVQPAGSNGSDAFDFADLTSSLAATAQKQQQHQQKEAKEKKQQQQQQRQNEQVLEAAAVDTGSGASEVAPSMRGTAGPVLPEFYLMAEPEPDASSVKGIPRQELQHVQQLLAAYEASEGPAAAAAAAGAASTSQISQAAAAAAAAAGGAAGDADGEGGVSWAGEEYEPDSVSCMQRGYLKFMKRVARQPQQCARYAHNGPLLWPKPQLPQPTPCLLCGGPRVFELQLMPALSQMVLEAAVMMQEQQLNVNGAVVNAVANWDWCTVAVFTCQASCCTSKGPNAAAECQLAFEEVFVVTEAECENQPGTAAAPRSVPSAAVAGTHEVAAFDDEDEADTATED